MKDHRKERAEARKKAEKHGRRLKRQPIFLSGNLRQILR